MKKTAKEIALTFAEKFQKNYPNKPLWEMMTELEKEIEQYTETQKKSDLDKLKKEHLEEISMRNEYYENKIERLERQYQNEYRENEDLVKEISKLKSQLSTKL